MISGLLAGIIAMIYWHFALVYSPAGIVGVQRLGNIKCYVGLVLVFCISFLLFFCVFSRIKGKWLEMPVVKYLFCVIGVFTLAGLLCPQVKNVWEFPVWITILIAVLFLFFVCGFTATGSKGSFSILFMIILFGILWGVAAASMNTFRSAPHGAFYDLHHSSAYMDSIFNVFRHKPFQGGLTDQYGHYALFFYLPLKIFGCNSASIAVVLGVLSAATYILCMLSFCMAVKSNIIRIVTVVVAGIAGLNPMLGSIYWQCYPHRLIFPAITIFMITFLTKKGIKKGWYIMLALIWNFESGIICSMAWFGFSVMYVLQKKKPMPRTFILFGIMLVVDVVIPFLLAIGIVNLYNFIVSTGSVKLLGIKDFIGMVVDDNYISYLRTDLLWGNELYIHKIFVFLLCFCWGVFHNRLFGIQGNEQKANFGISVSIMGLGLLTYYMNRTLAGSALVDLFFVLFLGLMVSGVQELAQSKWRIRKTTLPGLGKALCGIYACLFLAGCAMSNLNVYANFQEKYTTNVYNYNLFQEFTSQVKQGVPRRTWAKGEGTSAIYMELGWKNKAYEFGDVTTEDIMKHKRVFLIDKYYAAVPPEYQMVSEFAYNDVKFGYFVRK